MYEEFTVVCWCGPTENHSRAQLSFSMKLFGWDLKSLWQTANKQYCVSLLREGRLGEALESYQGGALDLEPPP
jgi:hypothetical protein